MTNKRQQLLDTFNYRFASKRFDPNKKIDDKDFETILETGRLSPSSLGLEPWKFLVVQDPELRQALKPISWGAQGQLDTASHFVILLARKNVRPESPYFQYHVREIRHMSEEMVSAMVEKTANFQRDNLRVYENDRALWDWASKQTYIPLGNMMTAAAYLGIDSCPIEGFQYENVAKVLADKGYLDTDEFWPSVMVAFGYRDAEPKREKTRRPAEEVIQWI
ncbi:MULTISPECIES: NAD(P)H-dependent oxidoreductase [unclassified Staphylococcus]|uniref:NAD(P)H-dependent oxidoreductase n=1 Tax=unclassified Staphylococcus TaxID=91994 RepID=UPI0021CEEB82|nr:MULTISPECIES: NAD(P)H-dependent oxidoreductase [unclassified Staphylococcus]UXR69465.1 NAD(P)H-dependent oxidoreductase [Staphylococcus sp. IVB6246]UXR73797.1 NAD(P)H-dependent oxidoreductase [Staphylococcus sp. IVB6238]UXR76117.1 NAD(P)H-dependent oxidoreductase [Staphylococcus sp. IVB6233]UXR80314.1 NAD(P)H-dependent oxidoreductase [Staphylococcus sp. IVB6218]